MTQVNQALGGCDDLTGGKLNRKTIKGNIKHKRTKKSKKVLRMSATDHFVGRDVWMFMI